MNGASEARMSGPATLGTSGASKARMSGPATLGTSGASKAGMSGPAYARDERGRGFGAAAAAGAGARSVANPQTAYAISPSVIHCAGVRPR